eukprot:COSAG02_NODE_99_length_37069_cov_24.910957_22_plen_120_part_00
MEGTRCSISWVLSRSGGRDPDKTLDAIFSKCCTGLGTLAMEAPFAFCNAWPATPSFYSALPVLTHGATTRCRSASAHYATMAYCSTNGDLASVRWNIASSSKGTTTVVLLPPLCTWPVL